MGMHNTSTPQMLNIKLIQMKMADFYMVVIKLSTSKSLKATSTFCFHDGVNIPLIIDILN